MISGDQDHFGEHILLKEVFICLITFAKSKSAILIVESFLAWNKYLYALNVRYVIFLIWISLNRVVLLIKL